MHYLILVICFNSVCMYLETCIQQTFLKYIHVLHTVLGNGGYKKIGNYNLCPQVAHKGCKYIKLYL